MPFVGYYHNGSVWDVMPGKPHKCHVPGTAFRPIYRVWECKKCGERWVHVRGYAMGGTMVTYWDRLQDVVDRDGRWVRKSGT
jgi:rubredoxin